MHIWCGIVNTTYDFVITLIKLIRVGSVQNNQFKKQDQNGFK